MKYEFITPSDPITFVANDDKVACFCSVMLGGGKAGCNREDGERIPSMLMFHEDAVAVVEGFLGCKMGAFLEANRKDISDCFLSFAYGDFSDRRTYDAAIAAITDSDKLAKFKKEHENENRSSMSTWVKSAWAYGEGFSKEKQKTETT